MNVKVREKCTFEFMSYFGQDESWICPAFYHACFLEMNPIE